MRKVILLFTLLAWIQSVLAVDKAPRLLRACIDNTDSTVTIEYSNSADACGSFVEHRIFGSEDGSTYNYLFSDANLNGRSVKVKIPNTNATQWSFYFETRYACNGTDTLKSNVLFIDVRKPDLNEIDSVSVDYTSQRYIIGWQANNQPDTKGYRIYENNGGINSTIDDTLNGLRYTIKSRLAPNSLAVTMAAFDSCNLYSEISAPHRPISLNAVLDTCTKTVNLTWNAYQGWVTETLDLHYSINGGNFNTKSLNINNLSTQHNGLALGDSVCFIVQAKNNAKPYTRSSSSNVSCVKLKQPVLPSVTYLSQVTVQDPGKIVVECYVENLGPSDSLVVYRTTNGETAIGFQKIANGSGNWYQFTDVGRPTDSRNDIYYARTFAPCLGGTSNTLTGNSLLLKINDGLLSWNPYINWDGNVQEYNVYGFDGSTWNILNSTTNTDFQTTDTSMFCYYVEAVENENTYNFSRTSKSNEVCVRRKASFFVPNALNMLSDNNTLTVIGPTIDYGNSTMQIFNRWGEVIFETDDILSGWSVDPSTNNIQLGIYFYDIAIFDIYGEKHRLSGSVRVIR